MIDFIISVGEVLANISAVVFIIGSSLAIYLSEQKQ